MPDSHQSAPYRFAEAALTLNGASVTSTDSDGLVDNETLGKTLLQN